MVSTKAEGTAEVGDRAPAVRGCQVVLTKGNSQCSGDHPSGCNRKPTGSCTPTSTQACSCLLALS